MKESLDFYAQLGAIIEKGVRELWDRMRENLGAVSLQIQLAVIYCF